MVSSTHWLASSSGMAMLERGGNAFDAAVVAGLVLHLAEPHLNGPAGDLSLILHGSGSGKMQVICGQGTAPAKATLGYYRDLGLDLVPQNGLLATVIPGAFDAWMMLLRDHGTMKLREIFEPALNYAYQGIPVLPKIHENLVNLKNLFDKEWTSSGNVFMPGGNMPQINQLLCNPQLGDTWSRLLSEAESISGSRESQIDAARRIFYKGFIAEAIDQHCRGDKILDSSGQRHCGVLEGHDLGHWEATYEDPIVLNYEGLEIGKCGPWSQGPVKLQTLALLRGMNLNNWDPLGVDFIHYIIEAFKLAFADREAYYGDPNFVNVPMDQLLSTEYNDRRRNLVSSQASMQLRPGIIAGFEAHMPEIDLITNDKQISKFDLNNETSFVDKIETPKDTCHVDVVDRWGNMVSATPSDGSIASSPVIPELGFGLNSRAQMFWLQEGLPSTLEPGKRPRTTLSPTMALRQGEGFLAYGTPGGDKQDQWQTIFLLRHLHMGFNLQEAIEAPCFHSEHFPESFNPRKADPGRIVLENHFPAEVIQELRKRGHRITVGPEWSEGRMCAVSKEENLLKAAANPRGMQGYAVGR